jgi:hypothetical protein
MRSRIEPMKRIARSQRRHRELIRNYFRAQEPISSGVVEGLNHKAKVTMRKSYGGHSCFSANSARGGSGTNSVLNLHIIETKHVNWVTLFHIRIPYRCQH